MSETATTTAPEGSVPAEGVTVPEGFVPAAQVEAAREEARRRYQGELDRVKAELAAAKSTSPAAPAASGSETKGFDPVAFRSELLRDVSGVVTMSQTASALRAEFPHADPSLFTAEKLATFTNPEALRLAVEDSHSRVAAILDAEKERIREELATEFAGRYPDASAAGVSGKPGVMGLAGDPTPAQLAAMSEAEFAAVPDEVVARVLGANP